MKRRKDLEMGILINDIINALANYMETVAGGRVRFVPDLIVICGGATAANELITFCLANPGDAFLIPTPYYPAFDRYLRWRTGVQLVPVVCQSSNDHFKITTLALEQAYEKALKDHTNVKGLIITNPSNPLGMTLDRETLESLVSFVNEKNIHLVCDEIYAASVFKNPNFISILEIAQDDSECKFNLIHVVYSLSKDLGFPGFRVGVIYSLNDAFVNCTRKMSSFRLVSTQTQYLIASMLSDEFVEKFIAESSRRLAARHKFFTQELAQVGISCFDSNAGLFCWMDLRPLLNDASLEGEMALCHTIIDEVKLNVSPGTSFRCPEPGWFRVCFANMDEETMKEALKRIRRYV